MDAHTEIINFAAAAWSLELIDDVPATDTDRGEIIRDLAAYGPAINEMEN
jgi:hypothetical protein